MSCSIFLFYRGVKIKMHPCVAGYKHQRSDGAVVAKCTCEKDTLTNVRIRTLRTAGITIPERFGKFDQIVKTLTCVEHATYESLTTNQCNICVCVSVLFINFLFLVRGGYI